MPLPVIDRVVRIAVGGPIAGGGSWANVWHARLLGADIWDEGEITSFHVVFRRFYEGAALAEGLEVQQFVAAGTEALIADYTPLDGTSGAFSQPMSMSSNTPDSLPAEVAEVLTIRTALRGRQNRGRIFLPAFAAGSLSPDGRIPAAVTVGLVAQATNVNAQLLSGGWELGVASYGPYKNPLTGVTSSDPLVNGGSVPHFTAVSQFSMDNMCDVIRGRKT